MGVLSDFFGGGGGTVTSVSSSSLPEWMSNAGRETFNFGANLANRKYQPYTGPRIAGLDSMEKSGLEMLSGAKNKPGHYLDMASGALNSGWKPRQWNDANRQRYMSPYVEGALKPVEAKMRRGFERNRITANDRAIRAGAFGNERRHIADAVRERDEEEAVGQMWSQGLDRGYQGALQAFMADENRFMADRDRKVAGNTALAGQWATLPGQVAGTLMQAGGVRRGNEQASYDAAYRDFAEARDWPEHNLNLLIGALNGVPINKTESTTTPVQGGSTGGQLAGLALTAKGLGLW